jgi:hypothetical protein
MCPTFAKTFLSVYLTQGLLFLVFFLLPLLLIEDESLNSGLYFIVATLVGAFMFVLLLRGTHPLKSSINDYQLFYGLIANIAFLSFITINVIEFARIFLAGTHQILYTDNSMRIEILPLKILAFPAYFLAISRLMVARKLANEKMAMLALVSILLTGSRGLAIFGLLAILLYRMGLHEFIRVRSIFIFILTIFCFIVIGYIREPIGMDPVSYLLLVLGSFNQFAVSSLSVDQCSIDASQVAQQFSSIFIGSLDGSRVTHWITECVSPGASAKGYGVASSIVAESILINSHLWPLVYIVVIFINALFVSFFLTSRHALFRAIGCAWLPFILYSVRAEILYPYVFLVKILFSMLALYLLQTLLKPFVIRSPSPERVV